jgi:NAD(P)-dependent dehydrogenase (short-subunit alcohol dehydrogenase family)
VTGAAQGIGRGIADRVAEAGADVIIFDVNPSAAAKTKAIVEERSGRAQVVEVDVSDCGTVADGVERAIDGLGPIHGLVNDAGIVREGVN